MTRTVVLTTESKAEYQGSDAQRQEEKKRRGEGGGGGRTVRKSEMR